MGRLYRQQVVFGDHWRGLAERQHRPILEVQAYRGDVCDRSGEVLARSVRVKSAFAEPRFMGPKGREPPSAADLAAAAGAVARALGYDGERERALLARFIDADGNPRGFCWIERRLDPERAERLRVAGVRGISLKDEYRREYPYGAETAHLIGLVRLDGEGELRGITGIERTLDDALQGIDGRREVVRDRSGGKILDDGMLSVPPEDGATVALTVDAVVQAYVAKHLARHAADWKPQGIAATLIEVKTGRILALASWPTYDPGSLWKLDPEALRFRPIMDTFEPGSIVKPLVVAAGLECGAITATSTFDCTSPRRVGMRTVTDLHPKPGRRTLREILAYSLNCGMVQIGALVGPVRLHAALERCGFGRPPGLGLPLEERGTIPPLGRWTSRWGYHSTVSVAQGYEMAVTQVQIASAFASLGNGGLRMRPQLIERIVDARGTVVRRFEPEVAGRVVDGRVLRDVITPALGDAVEIGTARRAKLEPWTIGGKTGTAKKQVGRGYDSRRNRSSFIALAPLEDPVVCIAVTVDDPKSRGGDPSGGVVAAPIVRDILADVLPYLRVPCSPKKESARDLGDGE